MTNEQHAWLAANHLFEPLGVPASGMIYTRVGHLLPDGTLASAAPSSAGARTRRATCYGGERAARPAPQGGDPAAPELGRRRRRLPAVSGAQARVGVTLI